MYVTSHSGQLSLLSSAGREMSASQGAVAVLCGWEGNRSSYVTLAMHQSLCGIILWDQWPTEGRWTPRLHSSKENGTFSLLSKIENCCYERRNRSHLSYAFRLQVSTVTFSC